jgi:hypothetical protein
MSTQREFPFQDRSSNEKSRPGAGNKKTWKLTDPTVEITESFRRYCENRQPPDLSPAALDCIRYCIARADRNAQILGEEVSLHHHSLFVIMALKCGHHELIPEFFLAAAAARGFGPTKPYPGSG